MERLPPYGECLLEVTSLQKLLVSHFGPAFLLRQGLRYLGGTSLAAGVLKL